MPLSCPRRERNDKGDVMRLWLSGVVLAAGLMAASTAFAADEIVIGTSLPKTGQYAETQFLQYQRSYDQWVRDVNAEWMGCPAPLLAKVCEGMTSSSVSEANPRLPDDAAAVLIDMPSTALLPRLSRSAHAGDTGADAGCGTLAARPRLSQRVGTVARRGAGTIHAGIALGATSRELGRH